MKLFWTIFLSFTVTLAKPQVDYCTQLNVAIEGIKNNFEAYTSFAHNTTGGSKAYYADFSFSAGKQGYVYKDETTKNHQFFQSVSPSPADYITIYKKIESCLVIRPEKWTKMDNDENTLVMFMCEDFGGQITLSNMGDEVVIQIERDPLKNLPVVGDNFCVQLIMLTNSVEYDFMSCRKEVSKTDNYGAYYTSDIQLNQRGFSGTMQVGTDMFDPNKKYNYYIETFDVDDISLDQLAEAVEECLETDGNWNKKESTYEEGWEFHKKGVMVRVTQSKVLESSEEETIYLKVTLD